MAYAHWLWVATSVEVCVLLLAPTRSSSSLTQLLEENFEGILSSDCFSAYNPQTAAAKQKCLTHLERDLEALTTSRFKGNQEFARQVCQILSSARTAHRDYHAHKLTDTELSQKRSELEAQLLCVLETPPTSRMACRCPTFKSATAKVLVGVVHVFNLPRS